ncbi:MAG: glucose PTS transporter subunit IIA [Lachnospiraceae bacterium]|nr:glucose PTS transporter subunit IIA [Lachnospiraceae bacterium]
MDYRICASQILEKLGGKENLISAAHCATRLRLVIADNSKVQKEELENVDGVKGVFEAAGQLQIIIGTGAVNKVYDEFIDLAGVEAASKDDVKKAAQDKAVWYKRAIKTLGDIFVPIIPAIVATGLLNGLLGGLSNVSGLEGFTSSQIYGLLNIFSNTALVFLPILIAISAAKIFGANQFLGAVIGMIMIHPDLTNAWSVPSIVAEGGTVDTLWSWFGAWDIAKTGYQGHVIPVIIAVWILAVVEKWLHKRVPEMLDLFVTPLCSVLVSGFLTMTVIGPIFAQIESVVLSGAQALIAIPFGVGAFIVGGVYAPTVVAGVHHMYNAIEMMMLADNGMNTWMPIATAANVAQGAAALAVAFKTKNAKIKSLATPASLSAFLGITEPAIFGVNIRFQKPFLAGMIGGACGAVVASMMKVYATANGVTGVFGFLITTNCFVGYLLTFVVAAAVAFVCSYAMYKDKEEVKETVEKPVESQVVDKKGDSFTVYTPAAGEVIKITEVKDDTFSSEALGKGFGVLTKEDVIKAPFNGKVTMVFDTKHALGLLSDDGVELLIHVGINTVELDGKGFEVFVKEGDTISLGQQLMKFDKNVIKENGYDPTTVVVVTNTDDFAGVTTLKTGNVKEEDKILTVEK